MCRNARSLQQAVPNFESSPREQPVERPNAPTPEQTNHWLRGLESASREQPPSSTTSAPVAGCHGGAGACGVGGVAGACAHAAGHSGAWAANGVAAACSAGGGGCLGEPGGSGCCTAPGSAEAATLVLGASIGAHSDQACMGPSALASLRCDSPRSPREGEVLRPRSPTPTKMLAWEEEEEEEERLRRGQASQGVDGDSDGEGRGDHTDCLIAKLIGACQRNDIDKAFALHERLRRMRIPLYEGVYKMIIECCMRTQQLGHAMQFYETLRSSGQRVSSRLITVLMEACAREQHGDKVYALWNDWCPPGELVAAAHAEVLVVALSALIRTMSPDLAMDLLSDAASRSGDALVTCLASSEVQLEELLDINDAVADEARMNGMLLEEVAGRFVVLGSTLKSLRQQVLQNAAEGLHRRRTGSGSEQNGDLLMEDVDLDLELAAM